MSEKILPALKPEDHSTQLLSGGELSVENVNVIKTEMSHLNLSKLADKTLFAHDHFTQYLQFPTVLFTGTISPQSQVGTTLYSTEVSPVLMKSTRLTRVANIASNFNQWTGSMRVRIIFTKAIFMQTKIICCYLPGYTNSDAEFLDVSDLYGAQYHAVMNPDNDNELSFEIPFISGKNYHNMKESTGLFIIKLFQPLVSSQPTGTTNSNIPFTILLSSDSDSKTPLTYRYLINPSLNNNTIEQIQRADLATQLSPQVDNSLNSYDNLSSSVARPVLEGDRNRTVAFLPRNVNIPVDAAGTLKQTDLISAMYGDFDDESLAQPNVMCKNLIANSGYVSLKGDKLSFVNQFLNTNALSFNINQFAPPIGTLKSKGLFRGAGTTYSTVREYLINDDRAQTTGNALFVQKLQNTSSSTTSGPVLIAFITSELPPGFTVGDYKLRDVMPMILNFDGPSIAPFGLGNDWYFNFRNGGVSSPGNRFSIVQQKYGNFACFCVTTFGGDKSTAIPFEGGAKLDLYSDLPNAEARPMVFSPNSVILEILQPNVNFNAMVNEFRLLKKRYRDELLSKPEFSHIMCYSSLTAEEAALAAKQGNFSSFELVDNNFYSAALDARFISELSPSERFNFIALFYAVKKGVNIVGKVVKYVEGALTFIESFLPGGIDPNSRDLTNEMMFIDLTSAEPVYFKISDQGYSRYIDPTIISQEMKTNFPIKNTDDFIDFPPAFRPLN
jgi:hypothetical protein